MRRERDALPVAPALIIIGVAAVVLLGVTVAVSVWPAATVILATALGALLVREVFVRVNLARAITRATVALRQLSFTGDEAESSISELLDELSTRLCTLLGADWAAISLTDDRGQLRLESIAGDAPFVLGEERDGNAIPREATPRQLAVPLSLGHARLGVVEVGLTSRRTFTRTDHELLRILADHLTTTVERARLVDAERRLRLGSSRARTHLTLLAEISIVLARALEDPRPALAETARLITRLLADGCVVHLVRADGVLERVAVENLAVMDFDGPALGTGYNEFERRFATTANGMRRVMETGTSELSFVRPDGRIEGVADALGEAFRTAGLKSWVIAPIKVRGLALGTIVVATGPERRGLRVSDREIVDELGNRMAVAIERSQLYQESRRAGVAAQQRATQLSNLVEATIAFNRSLQIQDLLDALVAQAQQLLDADYGGAWLRSSGSEASVGTRRADTERIGSALVDADGTALGFLSVERSSERPFSGDDESVLLLLARLASVALQNARLYDDVRLREERLSAVFAASPLSILELDLGGNVRDVNPAARSLFGLHGDEAVLPGEVRDVAGELIATATKRGLAETEISVALEQEVLHLSVSTAPLRDPRGTPLGVLMVISDRTGHKRLEEQLIEAHRYEAIAHLAGGIAHDFNNLLTIIVGYSDMMLRSPEAAALHDDLTAINEAGQLAAVITNQLLMLSRRQILKPVVVSPAHVCEGMMPMLRRLVGDRVTIESKYRRDAPIRIDHGQLEQVLFNLFLNSRDSMGGNGSIRVETSVSDDGRVVTLSVTDTGEGMDEDTIRRCREPFFTTKGRRGIGLGLATVTSVVERAGGRLDIRSQLGVGTTIAACFPVARGELFERGAIGSGGAARVLLVDDDELIRRYAVQVLKDGGYDVVDLGDAESALARVDAGESFDLIVSDVVLPRMSGFDLLRAVDRRSPGMARLLMTGFAGSDTWGTDLADVEVLSKPFSIDEFLAAAADALDAVRQGSNR